MHKEIRRKDRAIPKEEALVILKEAEYGFLGTVDAEGQPYTVPLSFTVGEGCIYFHCAATGRKLENIAANPKACFTVVGATKPVYSGSFSTYYESCIVFGKISQVTDETEKRSALMALASKYLPEFMDKADEAITKSWKATLVFTVSMDVVTGKAKRK